MSADNEPQQPARRSALLRGFVLLFQLPLLLVTWSLELVLSRRGLCIVL